MCGRARVAKAVTLWVSSPSRTWHPRCVLPRHAPNPAAEEAESFLHAALYAPEPFASVGYLRRACHSPRRAPPVKAETISASHKESLMRDRKISRMFLKTLSVVALCVAFGAAAVAQSTATLQGVITDPQGAVVPN